MLSVPWIVRAPGLGVEPGEYLPVTSSIDVFPTLAGLCGIDVRERGADGRDLSRALLGREQPTEELAFSHTSTISEQTIADFQRWGLASRFFGGMEVGRIWVRVRAGDMVFKYRNLDGERWGFQAYDLAVDPREERDLFDPSDPDHAAMAARLRGYKALLVERHGQASTEAPEDALDRLKDLGYVSDDG